MIPDKRFQRAREAESMVEIKIEIESRLHCIDIQCTTKCYTVHTASCTDVHGHKAKRWQIYI